MLLSDTRVGSVAVVAGLITYGSLYPFDFEAPSNAGHMFRAFLNDWRVWTSRGDVLGNVGLFVPLGLAGVWSVHEKAAHLRAAAATFAGGIAFAFALQVIQVWVASRSALLADVLWNAAGIGLGMAIGLALHTSRATRDVTLEPVRSAAMALVALWLVAELAPLVPSLDFAGVTASLKPILLRPRFELVPTVFIAAQALLAVTLAEAAARPHYPQRVPAILLSTVLVGKLIIIDQQVDLPTVVGFIVAFALWGVFIRLERPAALRWLFVAVMATYSLEALSPFTFRSAPARFSWVPFAASLDGSMLTNVRALFGTAYVLGAAVWLAGEIGWPARRVSVLIAFGVLSLEATQMWIVGRTPGITDPLLAICAGLGLGASRRSTRLRGESSPSRLFSPERGLVGGGQDSRN